MENNPSPDSALVPVNPLPIISPDDPAARPTPESGGGIDRVLSVIGVIAFLVTLGSTLCGVIARYFHVPGFEWSFEVAGIAFIWVTFIGAAVAEKNNQNVHFDGVLSQFSASWQRRLAIVGALMLLLVSVWLVASGIAFGQRAGSVHTSVLGLPGWVTITALLVSAIALAIFALLRLFAQWRVAFSSTASDGHHS
ncbi:TRAP transporter small permease [Robbsia andropogonis]|uniref:TRAP transporter small permease n=1 Tax=Robbsia andropogonis TaxID=28092 RepID=UPI0004679AC7|nr:TRAP transporter small permease [Robbsia andropogonis]